MNKIKIGFVGCGQMGQLAHIANYATLPDVELVALADFRQETAKAVARRYGISNVYRDHQEMLEKADLDAVVAIVWFDYHHVIARDILEKGKHCFTEKPIALNVATAQRLVALAKKNKVVYQIGYMKRSDLASRMMKETMQAWRKSGEYGALKLFQIPVASGPWLFGMEPPINKNDKTDCQDMIKDNPPEWMDKETAERYHPFINGHSHQINLLHYFLGEGYKIQYVDSKEIIVVAQSDTGVPIVWEKNPGYSVRDEYHESYNAYFERGKISLSLAAPLARQRSGKLEIYKNAKDRAWHEIPTFPPRWSMLEQARLFVDAVQGKIACISPAEDAVKDLQVAEDYFRFIKR